jgi:5,6-dimethylbenzimidazole synthase
MENLKAPLAHAFADAERAAVYQAIFSRRDVRGQFLPEPVPDDVLGRILMAAHHAPSVGFMQPWSFQLVRSDALKQRVHDLFEQANAEAAQMFPDGRRDIYSRLKLQGIVDAPINLCVTCDRTRSGQSSSAGRTCRAWICSAASVPCRIYGWPPAPKASASAGSASFTNAPCRKCSASPPTSFRWPTCASAMFPISRTSLNSRQAGWLPRLPIADLIHYEQWGATDAAGHESPDRDS